MIHLWKMWRLMVFVEGLEPRYAKAHALEERDPNLRAHEMIARALARNGEPTHIARHHIALAYSKANDPDSIHKTQNVVDACVAAGYLAPPPIGEFAATEEQRNAFLDITPEGRKFVTFSYFIKKVKEDLGQTYAWIGGLLLAVIGGFLVNSLYI